MGGRVATCGVHVPALVGVALGCLAAAGRAGIRAQLADRQQPAPTGPGWRRRRTRIELRFLARPHAGPTKITVVGPDNVPAAGGAPSFSGSRVSVPFRPGKAGLYIVGYELPRPATATRCRGRCGSP